MVVFARVRGLTAEVIHAAMFACALSHLSHRPSSCSPSHGVFGPTPYPLLSQESPISLQTASKEAKHDLISLLNVEDFS